MAKKNARVTKKRKGGVKRSRKSNNRRKTKARNKRGGWQWPWSSPKVIPQPIVVPEKSAYEKHLEGLAVYEAEQAGIKELMRQDEEKRRKIWNRDKMIEYYIAQEAKEKAKARAEEYKRVEVIAKEYKENREQRKKDEAKMRKELEELDARIEEAKKADAKAKEDANGVGWNESRVKHSDSDSDLYGDWER